MSAKIASASTRSSTRTATSLACAGTSSWRPGAVRAREHSTCGEARTPEILRPGHRAAVLRLNLDRTEPAVGGGDGQVAGAGGGSLQRARRMRPSVAGGRRAPDRERAGVAAGESARPGIAAADEVDEILCGAVPGEMTVAAFQSRRQRRVL